jgi:hypothetical protein
MDWLCSMMTGDSEGKMNVLGYSDYWGCHHLEVSSLTCLVPDDLRAELSWNIPWNTYIVILCALHFLIAWKARLKLNGFLKASHRSHIVSLLPNSNGKAYPDSRAGDKDPTLSLRGVTHSFIVQSCLTKPCQSITLKNMNLGPHPDNSGFEDL